MTPPGAKALVLLLLDGESAATTRARRRASPATDAECCLVVVGENKVANRLARLGSRRDGVTPGRLQGPHLGTS
ncbi:MAG TPA: hypothetical protein VGO30_03410, partial [Mycobacterium sp.]|nr:hypothetical protein [Mycobacterium sp.]